MKDVKKIMVIQLRIEKKKKKKNKKKKKKKKNQPCFLELWKHWALIEREGNQKIQSICIHMQNIHTIGEDWNLIHQFNLGKQMWSLKAQKLTAEYESRWPWEGPLNFRTRDAHELWGRQQWT